MDELREDDGACFLHFIKTVCETSLEAHFCQEKYKNDEKSRMIKIINTHAK